VLARLQLHLTADRALLCLSNVMCRSSKVTDRALLSQRHVQVQYGYINLEEIFRDSTRLSVVDLSSLLLAKIAATSVCVGGGLVGGLFAPSLFIGALVGDIMGHFVANT
jgi:H+/Cl- antiporter ClcA